MIWHIKNGLRLSGPLWSFFYQPQQNGNDDRKWWLILALTPQNWEVLMKIENWRIKSHISTPYIESTPPQYCRVKYCTDFLWYSSTTYILCAYLSIVQIFLLMHFYTALVIEEWLLWLWFGTMLFYNFCGKLVENRNGFSTCYIPHSSAPEF